MINSINEQNNIDKIYLYAKDLSERKYEFLNNKRENVGIKHLNSPNAFTECSNKWMMFMRILMITLKSEKEKNNCL